MKKIILLLISSLVITSCNSQTDLVTLKPNQDISNIIKEIKDVEKEGDFDFGLKSYATVSVSSLKYGNVTFKNYLQDDTAKNSLISYQSNIRFLVTDYQSNNFAGLIFEIENEKEGVNLLKYLKNKEGSPVLQDAIDRDNYVQSQYLWYNDNSGFIIYLSQITKSFSKDKNPFISTELTILKKGLKAIPLSNNDPETIKEFLKHNPNGFDLIEIYKSKFDK